MSITPHSVIVMAPTSRWAQVREFFLSQGYELGDGVPMSVTGEAPATHLGGHMWFTEDESQVFTLRQTPQSYANGYTFGQATALMAQIRARHNGANINHGATPDASRDGRCFINTEDGVRLTKRAFFDEVAADASVQAIVEETP